MKISSSALKFPIEVKKGSVRVKIYRTVDRGRDRFTVAYHEGDRRRLIQFADLSEAKEEAGVIAEQLNAGRGAALELTGSDRDSYLYATSKLKALKIDLVPAIDEYIAAKKWEVPLAVAAKSYHESHHKKLPIRTVSEVVSEIPCGKES